MLAYRPRISHKTMKKNKNISSSSYSIYQDTIVKSHIPESRTIPELRDSMPFNDPNESQKILDCRSKRLWGLRFSKAILEGGGSSDTKKNQLLKDKIQKALTSGLTKRHIERILLDIEPNRKLYDCTKFSSHLLQIRYQRKVYMILPIATDNYEEFINHMNPLFKKHGITVVNALPLFHSAGYIETMISYRQGGDFLDLDKIVKKDAEDCDALEATITDAENGVVVFKCEPLSATSVARKVEAKGYKVISHYFDFKAKKFVELNWREMEGYENFIRKLHRFSEFEKVYDNVCFYDYD